MHRLFLAVLIALGGMSLFADIAPQVAIDVNGIDPDMIKLEKEQSSTLKVYHPGWQQGEKRDCYLAAKSGDLTKNWQTFSFSFIPAKSGKVKISLSGVVHRLANGKKAEIFTVYDDFKVTGADLKNPDFEQLNDHSNFIDWTPRQDWLLPFDTDHGRSVKVHCGNGLWQVFEVTKGKKVSVTFIAKGLEPYKEATTKPDKAKESVATAPTDNEGMWPALWYPSKEKLDEKELDLSPSKVKDISGDLQKRLDAGEKNMVLPDGTFRITKLTVPANVKIQGGAETTILFDSQDKPEVPIVELQGDNITFEKLNIKLHNNLLLQALDGKRLSVVKGENISNVLLSGIRYENSDIQYKFMRKGYSKQNLHRKKTILYRWDLFELTNCRDIEVKNCHFKNFSSGIKTTQCFRVSFHDNIGVNGLHNMMRFYSGSEYFRFYNNWFSHVKHPMVWDGGDCSPNHKNLNPTGVEAAQTVHRDMKLGDPDYAQHMTGTYEVMCYGNYAEYGKTLAWGRKGRRVIITGNSSRYMFDMAYDAEGCEEVIFANNFAANSKAAGIGIFYSNDSTIISGNMVVIEDKGHDIYKGQFVRLHSAFGVSSGKTIITGNLFVNRLKEPRFVKLDYCKNVVITNNKFVNGGVKTNPYGGGYMTITGNTFISSLPSQETLIIIEKSVREMTFRNNTMINRSLAAEAAGPAILLNLETTEKLRSEREGVVGWSAYRQLDGNSIRGWQTPLGITGAAPNATLILCNNISDVPFSVPNGIKSSIVKGNLAFGGKKAAGSEK